MGEFELWTLFFLPVPMLTWFHWNNDDQSVSGCKILCSPIYGLWEVPSSSVVVLRGPTFSFIHTYTHTCPSYISWWHAVWKRVKHWGPAPTVPSCLYELVTHSATNACRSQSQAPQHLCTSEYISVSWRVLELSGEFGLRTLATVRQPVGALSDLTYRKEQHVLLFTCPDCSRI